MAQSVRAGRLDRREFMALASILRFAARVAGSMLGMFAAAQESKMGSVLRIGAGSRHQRPAHIRLAAEIRRCAPGLRTACAVGG